MNFLPHSVDFPMPFIQLVFLSLEPLVFLHIGTCYMNTEISAQIFLLAVDLFLVSFKITCCALGMISAGYSRLKKEEAALNFFHL